MALWSIAVVVLLGLGVFVAYLVWRDGREKQVDLILGILRSLREATAVQIVQASDGQLFLPTAYGLLRDMEREELIGSRQDVSGDLSVRGGYPRVVYYLTGHGERHRSRRVLAFLHQASS